MGTRMNLNELVVRPSQFDGFKNKAREWIEDFEDAFQANDWTEATAIKYFPAFLKGTPRDWFQSMVKPKLATIKTWSDLRRSFERHYLGRDELRLLKKQFNELQQGHRELVTSFVPKAYRLLKIFNPTIGESDAIDRILDKLRPELITGLSLKEFEDIEDIVSKASKLEDSHRRVDERGKRYDSKPRTTRRESHSDSNQTKVKAYNSQNRQGIKASEQRPRQSNTNQTSEPNSATSSNKSTNPIMCYRCLRNRHMGRECRATIAADGKPVRMPRVRNDQVNAVQRELVPLNGNVAVKETINAIKGTSMLTHKIKCNSIEYIGLIDSGAFSTIVDERIALANNWEISGPPPLLEAAGSNRLSSRGTTKIDICKEYQT